MTYKEQSQADEVRQFVERNDEDLIDLILSGEERDEPRLDVGVFCPLCQGGDASNLGNIRRGFRESFLSNALY